MTLHFQHEWQPVVGQFVEIRLNFNVVRRGIVDAVTNDDQIMWIAADGSLPRMMFERSDGYHLWISYKWERQHRDMIKNCTPTSRLTVA